MACNGGDSANTPDPTPAPANTPDPTPAPTNAPSPTVAAIPTPTPEPLPDTGESAQISEQAAGIPPATDREAAAFRHHLTGAEIDFTGFGAHEEHSVPGFSEEELTEVCNFYAENDWPVPYKATSSDNKAVRDIMADDSVQGDVNVVGQRSLRDLYMMMNWSLSFAALSYAPSAVLLPYFEEPPSDDDDIEEQNRRLQPLAEWQRQLMMRVCESEAPASPATQEQTSVIEYFAQVCDSDEVPFEDMTWNEYRASLQASLDRVNSLTPPATVRAFHLAYVAAGQDLLDATDGFNGDLPIDAIEFSENQAYSDAQIALEAAIGKLDSISLKIFIAECS